MKTAARRDAIARHLAMHGNCTAGELAKRFESSTRTIMRDLEALRADGIAVVGQSGVGGGFSIDRAEITTAVRLKETEILALWVASELALRSGHLAFIKPARQAVQVLLTSLPSKRRRELLAFVRRIYLGPPASATVSASVGQVSQPLLDIIERAFTATHCLQIRYKDMHGQISQRTIEVHGLWIQAPIWYVLAFDHAKKAPRMFRVDRIMRAFPEEKRFSLRSLEIATALLTPHFDPSAMALL